jgi:cation transport regulator ChaC
VAYCVANEDRQPVLDNLDHRERGGFDRNEVRVEFSNPDRPPIQALMYVANARNRNFLGVASDAQIASQIRDSHGPSGANLEYALRLAESLREMGAADEHVFAIADLLRDDAS